MSNRKIITIQRNTNSVVPIIKKMRETNPIFYENVQSNITVGDRQIPIQFDKILANEEYLMLFLKNGKLNSEQILDLMEKESIPYSIVSFLKEQENYYYTLDSKQLSFVTEKETLKREIQNSKKKEIDSCSYYPNVYGTVTLSYQNSNGESEKIYKEQMKEIIDLEDRLILMKKGIPEEEIIETLMEEEMNVCIRKETKLSYPIKHKYYIKARRENEKRKI